METQRSVIYTAIFGGYDELDDPQMISKDYDYVCFTDDHNLKSDIWDVRVIDLPVLNDYPRSNRYVKIKPHEFLSEYEYSLYLDGSIFLKGVPNIIEILNEYNLAVEKHPRRECCIYKEAEQCKAIGYGIASEIDKQIKDYRSLGVPEYMGLWANGILFRKHNEVSLIELEEVWWEHIMKYSWRDQISFPCVFKEYPFRTLSPYYLFCHQIVGLKNHLRKV